MEKELNIGITINFEVSLYSNGLQQNIVILNNLINEIENFKSYYIYQGKKIETNLIDKKLCFPYEDILKNESIQFDLIIMMGITFSEKIISAIKNRNKNTKLILLQCGNQFVENMSYSIFDIDSTHTPLEKSNQIDQIWTLPHYKKNISFMKTFFKNHKAKCVPYIWDSIFIEHQINNSIYKDQEINFASINSKGFLIMEPNMFFSKNCILPIFIVEAFEQKYPNLMEGCHILCANKLAKNDYFIKLLLQLDIFKRKNFLKIQNRALFIDAIHQYGSILVSHQQDNALNYLYLEAFYLNIPLLHNSEEISNFGYYYPENDIDIALMELKKIIYLHNKNLSEYKKNCTNVLNKYSSRNKINKIKYKELILDVIKN